MNMKLMSFQENIGDKKIIECDLNNDIIYKKYYVSENDVVKIKENQFICMIEKGNVLDFEENSGYYIIKNIENNFKRNSIEKLDIKFKELKIRDAEEEKLCVIYIYQNIIKNNKYHINDPIKYNNWENGESIEIFINLEGYYDFKIENPAKFLSKAIGLRTHFSKQELIEKIRKFVLNSIEEGINEISKEYKLDIDTLAQNSKELEVKLKQNEYDLKLLEYGVKLTYFDITDFKTAKKKFKFF